MGGGQSSSKEVVVVKKGGIEEYEAVTEAIENQEARIMTYLVCTVGFYVFSKVFGEIYSGFRNRRSRRR